eukprot:CAMPEP_0170185312 /NCGR_PEP_ID=MMETSP0040_2-20121228/36240_1 /TAXON_ID=641309 /ORGANISM="Lotharella oceanica, Strain CCMP622" /LENGTH=366 /DNA_ID=CAMNT_0010431675 /DNA_START=63 /DNA_END=1166 /DNA_ORIENTATION=-
MRAQRLATSSLLTPIHNQHKDPTYSSSSSAAAAPSSSFAPVAPFATSMAALPLASTRRAGHSLRTQATKGGDQLFDNIADFYDSLSGIWEREYGEHMHHGWYGEGEEKSKSQITVQQAQVALMEELAKLGGIKELAEQIMATEGRRIRILDVGCGIGGASRWLANTFDADVTGISLSPTQIARATELAKEKQLSERTDFQVQNALSSTLPDGGFDVVWSLEMAEHIPDRDTFLKEIHRMLNKKHGRLAMVTWCKRDGMLDFDEEIALNYISEWYNLPRWISMERWASLAPGAGFESPTPLDWSQGVRPMQFWGDILVTSLQPKNIVGLLQIGDKGVKAGAAAALMAYGFYKDFIKFGAMRMDVKQA